MKLKKTGIVVYYLKQKMKLIEFNAMPRIEKGEEVWEPFIHILDRWAFVIGKPSIAYKVKKETKDESR